MRRAEVGQGGREKGICAVHGAHGGISLRHLQKKKTCQDCILEGEREEAAGWAGNDDFSHFLGGKARGTTVDEAVVLVGEGRVKIGNRAGGGPFDVGARVAGIELTPLVRVFRLPVTPFLDVNLWSPPLTGVDHGPWPADA